jgi:aryl-alcohol dehydrogenase-like predicted oxidoreductase
MRYRKFGATNMMVSEIGFGAWAIGGPAMIGNTAIGWGESDDRVSIQAIHAALDAGINFFDTADIYGLGHSEELLGKTIGIKKDVIIATKVGNVARNEQFTVDYSATYILKACELSLKRLQRDVIDLYQLHTAKIEHLQGDCIEAMIKLKEQGKIRHWGISLNTFEPEVEADHFIQKRIGNSFQLVFNLVNQKALNIIRTASEKGYGIIARMPLQFGLLTGKFDRIQSFTETDHRKKRLTQDVIHVASEKLDPVWQLCSKYNCNKYCNTWYQNTGASESEYRGNVCT